MDRLRAVEGDCIWHMFKEQTQEQDLYRDDTAPSQLLHALLICLSHLHACHTSISPMQLHLSAARPVRCRACRTVNQTICHATHTSRLAHKTTAKCHHSYPVRSTASDTIRSLFAHDHGQTITAGPCPDSDNGPAASIPQSLEPTCRWSITYVGPGGDGALLCDQFVGPGLCARCCVGYKAYLPDYKAYLPDKFCLLWPSAGHGASSHWRHLPRPLCRRIIRSWAAADAALACGAVKHPPHCRASLTSAQRHGTMHAAASSITFPQQALSICLHRTPLTAHAADRKQMAARYYPRTPPTARNWQHHNAPCRRSKC